MKLNSLDQDILGWAKHCYFDGIWNTKIANRRGVDDNKKSILSISRSIRKLYKLKFLKKSRHLGRNRYSYRITSKGRKAL